MVNVFLFQMQYLIRILVVALVVAGAMAWRGNKVYREPERTQVEHHHKMPPFLKNVSDDARWEFYEIIRDLSTSMNDKMKKIEEWAKKQGVEKQVQDWFKKIEAFWDDINKNTTKVLSELPSVYPKVYEIMSDMSLTPRELYAKIRALKLDRTVARSLHAVAMAVIHSGGQDPYLSMNAEVFLEKLTGGKVRRHVSRHRFRN
ncbi:hypothetical protein ANCCAN_16056 [Ancylostoma caninum]|uniref:SXP/RAL-2 family protein Ani s 5-like cation-binding domain-containing protein n=1 Tax=Ancylostoma caninum TaxID=29170 RepID=A0A368G4X0_ANCCA|nr:hypothetical protein ANCCAN_16056 [Ancylostoma caninum]